MRPWITVVLVLLPPVAAARRRHHVVGSGHADPALSGHAAATPLQGRSLRELPDTP